MEWLCGVSFGWVACMVLTRAGVRLMLMAERIDTRRELRRVALAQEQFLADRAPPATSKDVRCGRGALNYSRWN